MGMGTKAANSQAAHALNQPCLHTCITADALCLLQDVKTWQITAEQEDITGCHEALKL